MLNRQPLVELKPEELLNRFRSKKDIYTYMTVHCNFIMLLSYIYSELIFTRPKQDKNYFPLSCLKRRKIGSQS